MPCRQTSWRTTSSAMMTFLRGFLTALTSSVAIANGLGLSSKKFKAEGLVELGSLGLERLNGSIIALGDSNADQFQDIFVLSQDQRSISLYLWDRELFQFIPVPNNPIVSHSSTQFVISNLILTDLNHDGRLDMLIMGSNNPGGPFNEVTSMQVSYGIDGQTFTDSMTIPSSLSPHPLAIDAFGTMKIDLIGLPSSLPSIFKLWKNRASSQNLTTPPFEIVDIPFQSQPECQLPNPHSNAFIDLDGDCLADVFLTCEDEMGRQTFQIWTNLKSQGFTLSLQGSLPTATRQISFGDVDRDGTMDMIFATCPTPEDCVIHVAYNLQIPLCKNNLDLKECRDPQDLCTADPNFKFSFEPSHSAFSSFSISQLFPGLRLLTHQSPKEFRGQSPIPIQLGDINLDGYPDLLLLLGTSTSSTPRLLRSVPCTPSRCTSEEIDDHRRSFLVGVEKALDPLNSIDDAKSVFFMDIDEDGTLDIVVQRAGSGSADRNILFIQNNFFNDAFFLKASVLNGACSTWCPARDGQPEYRPYGVNYPGGSYKFTIQDTYGTRRATAVAQIGFQAYPSPTTPYVFVGLGRTNNYIENIIIGTTSHAPQHTLALEGLLPNSQLVVIPFGDDPKAWGRQLYLFPGDWIPWVAVTLAIATAILGVIVAVLHINEKRDDERERRRKAHTINFDAL